MQHDFGILCLHIRMSCLRCANAAQRSLRTEHREPCTIDICAVCWKTSTARTLNWRAGRTSRRFHSVEIIRMKFARHTTTHTDENTALVLRAFICTSFPSIATDRIGKLLTVLLLLLPTDERRSRNRRKRSRKKITQPETIFTLCCVRSENGCAPFPLHAIARVPQSLHRSVNTIWNMVNTRHTIRSANCQSFYFFVGGIGIGEGRGRWGK